MRSYIHPWRHLARRDGIAPEHRPLFDRLHRLILAAHPGAAVVLSYKIPTYKVGGRRLYVGVWKHGVSIYGWQQAATPASPPGGPRPPWSWYHWG